jgi:hypothetical protein
MEMPREHCLAIFLAITGFGWIAAFCAMEPNSKWGQPDGNIANSRPGFDDETLEGSRFKTALSSRHICSLPLP